MYDRILGVDRSERLMEYQRLTDAGWASYDDDTYYATLAQTKSS